MTDDEIAREVAKAARRYIAKYDFGVSFVLHDVEGNVNIKYGLRDEMGAEADRLNGLNAIATYRRLTEGK